MRWSLCNYEMIKIQPSSCSMALASTPTDVHPPFSEKIFLEEDESSELIPIASSLSKHSSKALLGERQPALLVTEFWASESCLSLFSLLNRYDYSGSFLNKSAFADLPSSSTIGW